MNDEDQKLKSLYRDASAETVPQRLDDSILKIARQDATRNWRPFAMAATILLSVGFLLNIDMAQLGAPDRVDETSLESAAEEFLGNQTDDTVTVDRAMQSPASAPKQESETTAGPTALSAAKPDASASSEPAADYASEDSAPARVRALETLSDKSRNSNPDSVLATQQEQKATPRRYCPESLTAAPGSWYTCILELRDQGLESQASHEQTLLREKYPAFETP